MYKSLNASWMISPGKKRQWTRVLSTHWKIQQRKKASTLNISSESTTIDEFVNVGTVNVYHQKVGYSTLLLLVRSVLPKTFLSCSLWWISEVSDWCFLFVFLEEHRIYHEYPEYWVQCENLETKILISFLYRMKFLGTTWLKTGFVSLLTWTK